MDTTLTTYYARRTNVFVWLAVLCMLISAATRLVYAFGGGIGPMSTVIRILFPLAANFAMISRLLFKGEEQFYTTRGPVALFAINNIATIITFSAISTSRYSVVAGLLLCLLQAMLYWQTFGGKSATQIPVFFAYLLSISAYLTDRVFMGEPVAGWRDFHYYTFSDIAFFLGILCTILATRKMPEWQEGDPYRLRPGDRIDGRLIRSGDPINRISPYIMVHRNGASNCIKDRVEVGNTERYIREKRRQGLKNFGIMHVFVAAYVRCCSEMPGINRFLSGQKVFHRFGITVNMVVKKEMNKEASETVIKVNFEPGDNAETVYQKFNAAVQEAKANTDLNSEFDKLAKLLNYIPGLFLKFTVWMLKLADYFGKLPCVLLSLSPFHGSMFVTSMGSLGIPPVYHHLYDFGNISQFCALGHKYTETRYDKDGRVIKKKYIEFTSVSDERIVDGFYYAAALRRIKYLLSHPDKLDETIEPVCDID